MANDLFDLYQDAIGDQLINQASSMLGETAQNTSAAMGIILPALVGSLIQNGDTETGAKDLMDFLAHNNFDGSLLPKTGGLLSGGASTSGLLSSGGNVLKYLVGDKLGSLIDLVSGSSGIKTGSAASLLKMTAPLMLSVVGKHIKKRRLLAADVRDFLLDQRASVMTSANSRVSEVLGFENFAKIGEGMEKEVDIASDYSRKKDADSQPMLNKLLPWLVLLLAALALLYFLGRGCAGAKNRVDNQPEATEEPMNNTAISAATADSGSQTVKKESGTVTSKGSLKVESSKGSGVTQISQALSAGSVNLNTPYILDKGEFQGRSAVLTSATETELEKLATLLKTYPNTQIRIEAHTDNSGNADINKQLSTQQALAVMTFLQSRGIALNRMSTAGRGQTKPIASNDTDAGKEQNKRIEIYVVKGN